MSRDVIFEVTFRTSRPLTQEDAQALLVNFSELHKVAPNTYRVRSGHQGEVGRSLAYAMDTIMPTLEPRGHVRLVPVEVHEVLVTGEDGEW